MPRGVHLSKEIRKLIHHYLCILEASPEQVHNLLFYDDHSIVTISHLQKLLRFFKTGDPILIAGYLNCDAPRKGAAGRPRSMQPSDCQVLRGIIERRRNCRLKTITSKFSDLFDDEYRSVPCQCTLHGTLKRLGISRKKLTRRHINQDPIKQLEFLDRVSYLSADRIIDMDGIHFNPKDNLERFGWADVGKEALILQIVLFNVTYAVHAAMGEDGFIAWDIFDCNVGTEHIIHFIRHHLAPVFPKNAFLILDNARNQNNPLVHAAMEELIDGNYEFASAYSPQLKPIERGFSMIRNWIRENELHANQYDPTALINQAFHLYSVGGERGYKCFELFDFYRENHQQFLQENRLI